jgi:hypothetical protein
METVPLNMRIPVELNEKIEAVRGWRTKTDGVIDLIEKGLSLDDLQKAAPTVDFIVALRKAIAEQQPS